MILLPYGIKLLGYLMGLSNGLVTFNKNALLPRIF